MSTALTLKKKPRYIRVGELRDLGYKLTGEQLALGDKPIKYGILEVKNEDNTKEVSFCLLFSTRSMQGVILPRPYHFYELHSVINVEDFVDQMGLS